MYTRTQRVENFFREKNDFLSPYQKKEENRLRTCSEATPKLIFKAKSRSHKIDREKSVTSC